eukprot:441846_1
MASHSTVTTPLINRSQSDPSSAIADRQDSLSVPSKIRHQPHDDMLHHDIDSIRRGFSTRRYSVEFLPVKSPHGRPEMKEEIIVPARDYLVKMPFFTTPLTLESTNNAFYDFRERLIEMGFSTQAEAALVHTQCESVEDAVTFIIHNMNAIYHRFEDSYHVHHMGGQHNETHTLCARCQRPFYQHLLDQNGNKIQIDINDANYNENEDLYVNIDAKQEETIDVATQYTAIRDTLHYVESLASPPHMYNENVMTELCLICFQHQPLNQFMTNECGHNQYCKRCLTEHYKIKTQNGDVLKVKCIDPRCEREVKENEILNFLTDSELREKFIRFKRQKLLMLDENARFCLTADCDGYMIGSRLKPKLTCEECKTTICFNCSKLWHGYFTKCSSAQTAEDANEAKFIEWESEKKEGVKKCPKCKIRIEKNEGCNHMTCQSCKYEFCWICRGKYDGNHFNQWNIFGCPGAQYSRGQVCSIQRCPDCFPMWFRRLLIIIAFLLVLPIILACGIVGGCVYGCAICVMFVLHRCCDCC